MPEENTFSCCLIITPAHQNLFQQCPLPSLLQCIPWNHQPLPTHSNLIDSDSGKFLHFPIWTFEHPDSMRKKKWETSGNERIKNWRLWWIIKKLISQHEPRRRLSAKKMEPNTCHHIFANMLKELLAWMAYFISTKLPIKKISTKLPSSSSLSLPLFFFFFFFFNFLVLFCSTITKLNFKIQI